MTTPSPTPVRNRTAWAPHSVALLIAFVFAVGPLLYAADLYLTFELPKVIFVQVATEIAFLVWMLHRLLHRTPRTGRRASLWPAALLVFLFVQMLIYETAYSTTQAFWGNYHRRQGVWLLLHYIGLLAMTADVGRRAAHRKLILGGVVTGALGAATMGFLEIWNIPAYAGWKTSLYSGRLLSSFGQPNFFAAYVGMAIPLVGYGLLHARRFGVKILALTLLVILMSAMLLSGSRGGWIGLSLAACCVLLSRARRRNLRQLLLPAAGGLLLLAVGFSFFMLDQRQDWRIRQLFEPDRWDRIERVQIWRNAWELSAHRLWLGHGQDNFDLVFPGVVTATDDVIRNLVIDRAHNWVLDWTVQGGLLGLAAFSALTAIVLRLSRRQELPTLGLWLAAGVWLHLVQGMVNVNSVMNEALFWVYLGLLIALAEPQPAATDGTPMRPAYGRYGLAVAATFAVAASLVWNYRLWEADAAYKEGLRALRSETADMPFAEAIRLAPHIERYRLEAGEYYLGLADGADAATSVHYLRRALAVLTVPAPEAAVSAYRYDLLSRIYLEGGPDLSADWAALNRRYAERAAALQPAKY
jgi:O-antigen ligase